MLNSKSLQTSHDSIMRSDWAEIISIKEFQKNDSGDPRFFEKKKKNVLWTGKKNRNLPESCVTRYISPKINTGLKKNPLTL